MILKKEGNLIAVRFDDGEPFPMGLIQALPARNVFVVLSAVGMLECAEVGYFDGERYRKMRLEKPGEVVSLEGSVIPGEEPPFHFHVCLGFEDGNVRGGHLFGATVKNTLELFLLQTDIQARRVQRGKLRLIEF